jgi:hypothetical protein
MAERRKRDIRTSATPARANRVVTVTVAAGGDEDSVEAKANSQAQEFLDNFRTNYRLASDVTAELRRNQKEDMEFRAGDRQWDETSRQERAMEGRPCLTINRIPQFIRQVTNAQRAQNLAIKVSPVDDRADIKVAEVYQGLIRNIEQQSDAQVAYSTASEHQVTIGTGYWRIVTEYSDESSFQQDIKIKRVRNPFTVYFDPTCMEADFSDARFCFVVEDIPKDEFKTRFGDDAFQSLSSFQSIGDQIPDWAPDNAVRIAEYWYVEKPTEKLLLIETSDGQRDTIFQEEYDAVAKIATEQGLTPPRIVTFRMAQRRKVYFSLVCQNRVLEGNEDKTAGRLWPGKFIPIVPVLGDEIELNGKVDYRGMVRDARDPQRLYNFQNTALAETLALAPKAPWVGYLGQFEGLERKWNQANRKNFAYLEVKPVSVNGQIAPLPQRIQAEPPIQAIVMAIGQADNDLKATMGLFDPSLGQRNSAQQSGKAILALQKSGEMANSNFLDNLSRAIRYTGRILIDLIPKIYDAPRVVRYMGLDDQEKAVIVHAGQAGQAEALKQFYQDSGIAGIYDLNAGKFDVAISSGPSVATKRQEAAQSLNDLITAYPEAFPVLGDLLMSNLDFPGSQAAAARLKKGVPPQFKDDDPEGAPPIPPEVQQQMAQMQQQNQLLLQELQKAKQVVDQKLIEASTKKLEILSRERIEAMRAQIELLRSKNDNANDLAIAELNGRLKLLEQLRDHLHESAMASADVAHELHSASVDRVHEATKDGIAQAHADRNQSIDRAHEAQIRAEDAARQSPPPRTGRPRPSR